MYKIPCGNCDSGTYTYQAVIDGLSIFRGCDSVKTALSIAPKCKNDNKHICYGARDFIMACTFPLTMEIEEKIIFEISK